MCVCVCVCVKTPKQLSGADPPFLREGWGVGGAHKGNVMIVQDKKGHHNIMKKTK